MAGYFTKMLAKWDKETNRLRKIAWAEQDAKLRAAQKAHDAKAQKA